MRKHIYLLFTLTTVFSSCDTEEPIPTYTLSTTISPIEGGKITVSPQAPNYKEGEVVTLTPEPNDHWVFEKWEGDASGSTTPLQITMNSDKSVTGAFIKKNYQLTINIEGEGTVEESIITNPSGREYPHETTVELTPVPKEGWEFESWGGDLTGSETPKTITVDKEMNVTAKFEIVPTITSLDCQSSTNSGVLEVGEEAINISSIIPYTGGNGGTHSGQTVSSTGVTGLTATLTAGTFANGSGSLTYTITGTPSTSGTASFALDIGGQTCTLSRAVAADQPTYPAGFVFGPSGPTIIIDVTNPSTGKTWMDRNLGATQVATGSTDAASYGDLYQWGRGPDGHQVRITGETATLSSRDNPGHGDFITTNLSPYDWRSPQNKDLWQGVSGVNNPCPSGYRLPTEAELNAERLSWSSDNAAGAIFSPLKLPMAGRRDKFDGSLSADGRYGYYWSSTFSSTISRRLIFSSSSANMLANTRAEGNSVRCLKD